MRELRIVGVLLAGLVGLPAASPAAAATRELSARYSAVVAPGYGHVNGWQGSLGLVSRDGRSAFVVDGGAYYGSFDSGYVVMAGPRLIRALDARVSLFGQVMLGALFAGEGVVLVGHPGIGVDLTVARDMTLRTQIDWPLASSGGATLQAARVSVGFAYRFDP